jgi:mannose-1-phosphate guanylyltransferase/mannose-6-phosphate isomerase
LLQETVLRFSNVDHYHPPIVVCGEDHRFLAAEQIRQIGITPQALIIEPAARGTAPAIALATFKAMQAGDPSPIIVSPADHVLGVGGYPRETIEAAIMAARDGNIVTFGVRPTFPATGYGYIVADGKMSDGTRYLHVEKFVEKPDRAIATELIRSGTSFWNAGVFVGHPEVILAELETRHADIVRECRIAIDNAVSDLDFCRPRSDGFAFLEPISIDYAIMEHTKIAATVPIEVAWSDVGSWTALWEILEKDGGMNVVRGPVQMVDTKGSFLRSEGPLLAAIGIEDLVVIADTDVVLVARRQDGERVREIVDALAKSGRPETKMRREVLRPWGSYTCIDAGDGFQVKRIVVKPHQKLSLQKHRHRAEHWIVVRGEALVRRGSETFRLLANQSTDIPLGEVHRLENDTAEPLHLIEVQSGAYLGEDDIVRLEDNYGRQGQS